MRQEETHYFAVGIFVIAALALLIVTLLQLSRGHHAVDTYHVIFSNVTDIREGSGVTYGGYQIGTVSGIAPLRESGQTRFRLALSIREDWPIPLDSVARITSPGLLSDSTIDISEGVATETVAAGETILTDAAGGVMAAVDAVSNEFQDLSRNNIKPLLDSLNRQVDNIGTQLSGTLPGITANLEATLAKLAHASDQLSRMVSGVNQTHLTAILENADSAVQNLATLSENLNATNRKLNGVLDDAGGLISDNSADIKQALTDLRHTTHTVSAHIESIVFHLESASRNANEFTRQVRSNPSSLLSGSPPPDRGATQ